MHAHPTSQEEGGDNKSYESSKFETVLKEGESVAVGGAKPTGHILATDGKPSSDNGGKAAAERRLPAERHDTTGIFSSNVAWEEKIRLLGLAKKEAWSGGTSRFTQRLLGVKAAPRIPLSNILLIAVPFINQCSGPSTLTSSITDMRHRLMMACNDSHALLTTNLALHCQIGRSE